MEDFQEVLVDVRLALEAVLYLVYVVDGVVELYWLTGGARYGARCRRCHVVQAAPLRLRA